MKLPMQLVQRWTTESEFEEWREFLYGDDGAADQVEKLDLYLARLTAAVHKLISAVLTGTPGNARAKDFLIVLNKKQEQEPRAELSKEVRAESMRARHMVAFGLAKGPNVRRTRLRKPARTPEAR